MRHQRGWPCPVPGSPWHWHVSGARSAGLRTAGARRRSRAGLRLPGPAHLALHTAHTHLTPLCHEAEAEAVGTLPRGQAEGLQVRLEVQCPPKPSQQGATETEGHWKAGRLRQSPCTGRGRRLHLHRGQRGQRGHRGHRGQRPGLRTREEASPKLLGFKAKSGQTPNNQSGCWNLPSHPAWPPATTDPTGPRRPGHMAATSDKSSLLPPPWYLPDKCPPAQALAR